MIIINIKIHQCMARVKWRAVIKKAQSVMPNEIRMLC